MLYVQKFEWFGKEDWEFYRNRRDINWQQYEYFAENMAGELETIETRVGELLLSTALGVTA